MNCKGCFWMYNCPDFGEVCDNYSPIFENEPQPSGWSYEDWLKYIAEYGDGNTDYLEVV